MLGPYIPHNNILYKCINFVSQERKATTHKEFTIEFDITSGIFALSFKGTVDSESVYLVPSSNNVIVTHKTDVPDYVFRYEQVLNANIAQEHLEQVCQKEQL